MLATLAARAGLSKWTTNVDEALADPHNQIYFDAQTTDRRVTAVTRASTCVADNDRVEFWLFQPFR